MLLSTGQRQPCNVWPLRPPSLATDSVDRAALKDKSVCLKPSKLHAALDALTKSLPPRHSGPRGSTLPQTSLGRRPPTPPRTSSPPWQLLCRLTCSRWRELSPPATLMRAWHIFCCFAASKQLAVPPCWPQYLGPGTHQECSPEAAPPAAGQPAEPTPGRAWRPWRVRGRLPDDVVGSLEPLGFEGLGDGRVGQGGQRHVQVGGHQAQGLGDNVIGGRAANRVGSQQAAKHLATSRAFETNGSCGRVELEL